MELFIKNVQSQFDLPESDPVISVVVGEISQNILEDTDGFFLAFIQQHGFTGDKPHDHAIIDTWLEAELRTNFDWLLTKYDEMSQGKLPGSYPTGVLIALKGALPNLSHEQVLVAAKQLI